MQIEIGQDGRPNYILDKDDAFRGDGSERVGYGNPQGSGGPSVTFYAKALHNKSDSLDQSKPFFRSVVYLKLQHPGERDVLERPATKQDAQRFPSAYRRYCESRQDVPDGIPLAVLFPEHPDIVQALNYQKVWTCEQLAELSDTALQNVGMGGYEWQKKAKRYLDHLNRGSGFAAHEERIRRQEVELAQQRKLNEDLNVQLQRLTAQMAQMLQGAAQPGFPMGQAPAMAAMPQPAWTPPVNKQPNGFAAAGPGEIGADDHVQQPLGAPPAAEPEPVSVDTGGDTFMDDLVAQSSTPKRGKR
jgi:hypothetical protein